MGIHKKIFGGEQYLPFALSKLRRLAERAKQHGTPTEESWNVDDGATIRLAVVGNEQFVEISGGGAGIRGYQLGEYNPRTPSKVPVIIPSVGGSGYFPEGAPYPPYGISTGTVTFSTMLSPDGKYATVVRDSFPVGGPDETQVSFLKAGEDPDMPEVLATQTFEYSIFLTHGLRVHNDQSGQETCVVSTIGNITPFVYIDHVALNEIGPKYTSIIWVDKDGVKQTRQIENYLYIADEPYDPPEFGADLGTYTGWTRYQRKIHSVLATDERVYALVYYTMDMDTYLEPFDMPPGQQDRSKRRAQARYEQHLYTFSSDGATVIEPVLQSGLGSATFVAWGAGTDTSFDPSSVVVESAAGRGRDTYGGIIARLKNGKVKPDVLLCDYVTRPFTRSAQFCVKRLALMRRQADGEWTEKLLLEGTFSGMTFTASYVVGDGFEKQVYPSPGVTVGNITYTLGGSVMFGLGALEATGTYAHRDARDPFNQYDPDDPDDASDIYAPRWGAHVSGKVIRAMDTVDGQVRTLTCQTDPFSVSFTNPEDYPVPDGEEEKNGAIASSGFRAKPNKIE